MIIYIIISIIYLLVSTWIFNFIYNKYLDIIVIRHNNINEKLKNQNKPFRELINKEDLRSKITIPIFIISSILSILFSLKSFTGLSSFLFIKNLFYYHLAFYLVYIIIKSIINKFKRTSDYIQFGSKIFKSKKNNNKKRP